MVYVGFSLFIFPFILDIHQESTVGNIKNQDHIELTKNNSNHEKVNNVLYLIRQVDITNNRNC
jgi:hypothetical protein